MNKNLLLIAVFAIGAMFVSCDNGDKDDISDYFNLFSVNDDVAFGYQMDSSIMADPVNFPVLDKAANPEAYLYIETMLDHILSSELIAHENDFDWQIRIIDSEVKNAFATPGGKLYFYTGIIDYLDNASQLAGVLAHEVAHSDRRHSTQQMSKAYGSSILLSMVLGESGETSFGQIALDMASGLSSLKFSRDDEYEADEYSVKYLNSVRLQKSYDPKGITGFFIKLEAEGYSNDSFEFLKTHPTDDNRVSNIETVWEELGSPEGEGFEEEYAAFKQVLGL